MFFAYVRYEIAIFQRGCTLTYVMEKQIQDLILVTVMNTTKTEKSTGMSSFPEHSVPLNFTA